MAESQQIQLKLLQEVRKWPNFVQKAKFKVLIVCEALKLIQL
jgi:hypothetical protein